MTPPGRRPLAVGQGRPRPALLRLAAAGLAAAVLASACGLVGRAEPRPVAAVLERSNNLFEGSEVRVLGLRVGEVTALEPHGAHVLVRMELDPDVELPADAGASLVPEALLGERFVQLGPPYSGGPTLPDGAVIPLERSDVPAEVDEVLASFERFLSGLDPATLAGLVDAAADTLAGQGAGLNDLLGQGATTVRVLADASDDLMGIASSLADLNTDLATRDREVVRTIEDWSAVVRTFGEESDEIVAGVGNLRRLAVGIRRILDEHSDPLVADIEVLATSLSTVERNLERVGGLVRGGHRLFEGAGAAFEYDTARLPLDQQWDALSPALTRRLVARLVGLCLRHGVDECATPEFWQPHLPALLCLDGLVACSPDKASVADAIAAALGQLPAESVQRLADEVRQRPAAPPAAGPGEPPAGAPDGSGPPDGDAPALDRLPAPQVDGPAAPDDGQTWRDRFARFLEGGP